MRNLCCIAVTIALTAACRPPSPAASPTPEPLQPGLTIPEHVGSYAIAETTVFKPASAGFGYRFLGPNRMVADLYVYPIPSRVGSCVDACARDAVASEVRDFKAAIPVFLERGYYDSLTIVRDTTAMVPGVSTDGPGTHLALLMVKQRRPGVTHFYLFSMAGTYFKVRMDYEPGQSSDDEVEDFVSRLMTGIVARGP